MDVIAERQDSVLLIRVSGRIDGSNAAAFDRAVIAALETDDCTVLMDLENLSFITSAGLRTFAKVARRLRRGTGEHPGRVQRSENSQIRVRSRDLVRNAG